MKILPSIDKCQKSIHRFLNFVEIYFKIAATPILIRCVFKKMKSLATLLATCLMLTNCTQPSPDFLKKANEICHSTIVADTHIDFPWHMVEQKKWFTAGWEKYALSNPDGEFDLERSKNGGLSCAFMSIYVPAHFQDDGAERLRQVADSLIDLVHGMARAFPDRCAVPTRAADVEQNLKKGIISLPMGMENGAPIQKIEDVGYFHRRGIRYVTLTHGKDNHICDSSYDTTATHEGLSEFGREVVREMNRVGIMVDVSHLSDHAIEDVLAIATRPVVATHSACRHFTPGFERNLPDDLIRKIAAQGGVVQVPFAAVFLIEGARERWRGMADTLKIKGLDIRTPAGEAFVKNLEKEKNVRLFATAADVADHIEHIVRLVGVDAVGFGSDFDGVGPSMPPDLRDVSRFPVLVAELLRRGFSEADLKKICGGNLMRVWQANE